MAQISTTHVMFASVASESATETSALDQLGLFDACLKEKGRFTLKQQSSHVHEFEVCLRKTSVYTHPSTDFQYTIIVAKHLHDKDHQIYL